MPFSRDGRVFAVVWCCSGLAESVNSGRSMEHGAGCCQRAVSDTRLHRRSSPLIAAESGHSALQGFGRVKGRTARRIKNPPVLGVPGLCPWWVSDTSLRMKARSYLYTRLLFDEGLSTGHAQKPGLTQPDPLAPPIYQGLQPSEKTPVTVVSPLPSSAVMGS